MTIIRTSSDNSDFQQLAAALEQELQVRDGEDHAWYAQLNRIDFIEHVLVVYQQKLPVAIAAIRPYGPGVAEIKRMYVQPGFRKKGIARLVVQELEVWCRQLGYSNCVLETGKNQPEAIALYSSSHYEVVPNFGPYTESANSVCFKKQLR